MLETNWSLSGKRAASVIDFLIRFGLPESRLRLVGYASNRPIADVSEKTAPELEVARSQNRRVTLLIK
jgi:chemotaxis protein MotB